MALLVLADQNTKTHAGSPVAFESKAKRELGDAILLLDLAVQHAHHLVKAMGDPALKKLFEVDLQVIEELLQLAREKTSRL